MNRTLDDPMVIAEAEACRAALEKHSERAVRAIVAEYR